MRRRKIGLFFVGNYSWVGGLYYVLNIIKVLNKLPAERKPEIILFYVNDTPTELVKSIEYPFLNKVNLTGSNLIIRAINKFFRILFKRNFLFEHLIDKHSLSALYPIINHDPYLRKLKTKKINWIYDFQHHFLPENFSDEEIHTRNDTFELISKKSFHIAFSSYTEKAHFLNFYPSSKAKLTVLQFVSIIDDLYLPSEDILRSKYDLKNIPYFIISNQFWKHKNHSIVIEAIGLLKKYSNEVNFVFTGGIDKKRPEYKANLENRIVQLGLTNVKILGFINREDQLGLMKYSMAVIQPSKYEGWGTVVEDAKALQKGMIVSDIPIHREQVADLAIFFDPNDADKLAAIIEKIVNTGKPIKLDINYDKNIENFTEKILALYD